MLKVEYKSEEDIKKERELVEKRKKVKGLAKEFFGFSVVVTKSITGGDIYLSSLFGFPFNHGDIATIMPSTDSMKLNFREYEEKARKFGVMYEGMFNKGLTIRAEYPKSKI